MKQIKLKYTTVCKLFLNSVFHIFENKSQITWRQTFFLLFLLITHFRNNCTLRGVYNNTYCTVYTEILFNGTVHCQKYFISPSTYTLFILSIKCRFLSTKLAWLQQLFYKRLKARYRHPNGNQWKPMKSNGNQWNPMETNENQWKPMETNGNQ